MVLKLPIDKNININDKENIEINTNDIIINKQIKQSKIERANSTGIYSFNSNKKYFDFDVEKIINQGKKNSHSSSNIIIDDFNNNINKNKTFVNIDLNSKKMFSKTDRDKFIINRFNNEYLNKYEQNYSEPNTDSYKKINGQNNHFNFNYSSSDKLLPLSIHKNRKERFSAKPEIRTDVSKYNLNFMLEQKNTKRKYSSKLFENNNENCSMDIKKILYGNTRKNNCNLINNLSDKYLKPSYTAYNYNSYNCYNNFNKGITRKHLLDEIESHKSNNINLNMDDIHKLKYVIQNLSNAEINSMPISVFKEMKDLYDLIFRKFLKNNYI